MVIVFSPCGDSFPVLPTLDALNNPFPPVTHGRHAMPFSYLSPLKGGFYAIPTDDSIPPA